MTAQAPPSPNRVLVDMTWQEAEAAFASSPILLLPLGAVAKEHGPHLLLDNDRHLAEGLASRVMQREDVVLGPTVGFHHYPAFTRYPGSTSLRPEVARDLVIDLARGWASHGARRLYVLNTGLSTRRPLVAAQEALEREGVALRFTDFGAALADVERAVCEQEGGSHADESETSMMLALAPHRVRMAQAVKDFHPRTPGEPFVRHEGEQGTFSATGVWGDATLATADKGERLVAAVVEAVCADLAQLRRV